MTTVINTINDKFNSLTSLMSKNVSILNQFYINKKINNIYNTNLNDVITNIINNIIEINTLLKTSSFFEYYLLIFLYIDDLRTYFNKVIVSIVISILNEKVIKYTDITLIPGNSSNSINNLTTIYNNNQDKQSIINDNFELQTINIKTFKGNILKMENLYYINFVFKLITFKINRMINIYNLIVRTYYKNLF
jgi:hypothetical protein